MSVALLLGACSSGGRDTDQTGLAARASPTTSEEPSTTSAAPAETTTSTIAAVATTAAKAAAVTTAAPTRAAAPTQPPATPATTTQPRTTQPPTITIQNFAFAPQTLRVAVGTTVTATNNDAALHTWTGDGASPAWNSGDLTTTMSYSHVFNSPGTFAYHCARHANMTGSVIVG
ncbi:MAG: hypothetical protein QOG87_4362 [Actinomycetota bacterium]